MNDASAQDIGYVSMAVEGVREHPHHFLDALQNGHTVRLTSAGQPVMSVHAEPIVPEPHRAPVFGALKDQIAIDSAFFEPMALDVVQLPRSPVQYWDAHAEATVDAFFPPPPGSRREHQWVAAMDAFFVFAKDGALSPDERMGLLGCTAEELAMWETGARTLGTPDQYLRLLFVLRAHDTLRQDGGSEAMARAMWRRAQTMTQTLMQRLTTASLPALGAIVRGLERTVPEPEA